MNPLKILPDLLKIAAKALGIDIAGAAKAIVGETPLTAEQRVLLETELAKHEEALRQIDLEELKIAVSESVAMVQSSNKYVAGARPTMLYAATAISMFLAIVIGIVILKHTQIDWGAVGALNSLMLPLFGAGGYYIGQRTKEKMNGNGNSE